MNDLRIEPGRLKLEWDEARTERLLAGVQAHLNRQRRVRRAALASAALAGVAIISVRWNRGAIVATTAASAPAGAGHASLRLDEGSEIGFDPATAAVRVVEQGASRVRVEAVRGPARYSVVPRPGRTFEVRSGSVTVRVVGTEFLVEPRGESTWVEVSRGKVEVSWGGDAGDHTAVAAGDSGLYPPAHAAAGGARAVAAPKPADAPAPHGQPPKQAYRARVDGRDYRGAYAILAHNPALAGDTVHELLVAADVARLSDHPAAAVPYLQRILREHPRDERAPMAAFTLGRTLSGLGRTREAMTTFGRVHSDWPRSPLAEDALVRQAEAAAAIGEDAAARGLAAQYDRDHPNGRRRAEVRRYAGLE